MSSIERITVELGKNHYEIGVYHLLHTLRIGESGRKLDKIQVGGKTVCEETTVHNGDIVELYYLD